MAKLKLLISQSWLSRCGGEKQVAHANEGALIDDCHIPGYQPTGPSKGSVEGLSLVFETYTQYHLLTYLLWHLRVKPVGPSVDRAWNAIDGSFAVADHCDITHEPASR